MGYLAIGISTKPDKVKAINQLDPPLDISEVRSLLGFTNHLASPIGDGTKDYYKFLTCLFFFFEGHSNIKISCRRSHTQFAYAMGVRAGCHAASEFSGDSSHVDYTAQVPNQNRSQWMAAFQTRNYF